MISFQLVSLDGYGPTNRRTDRRTDGPTDGRTDIACYRDARTHLKRNSMLNLIFLGSYCIFSVIIKVKKYMLGLFWYTFIPSTNLGVFFHHRLSWPKIYETWRACPTKMETDKTHVGDILMHIVSPGVTPLSILWKHLDDDFLKPSYRKILLKFEK